MEVLNTNSVTKISGCEVCGSKTLASVFSLGEQPLCDDLKEISSPSYYCVRYPINVLLCENCLTAHQEYQIDKSLLFHKDYHYRAKMTNDVLNGMAELVSAVKKKKGDLTGKSVLDVGCNDGSLLDLFAKAGCYTFGIEPTGAAKDCSPQHKVLHKFFDKDTANSFLAKFGKPDVICFTNVFAHISDLNALISDLGLLIDQHTLVVIENHYLGSVVENFQFDTFYHEHPRTYSLASFTNIARKLKVNLVDYEFPKRYGGNIRVFLSSSEATMHDLNGRINRDLVSEKTLIRNVFGFQQRLTDWQTKIKTQLGDYHRQGLAVAGKAFPGRASIIINSLGLDHNDLPVIFEQPGSPKVGHYVPGTKIPIMIEENLNDYDVLVNFAWHINHEISTYLQRQGFNGKVVPIL